MASIIIEMRKPRDATWEKFGRFTASIVEIAELRALLKGRDDPYDVLDRIPKGLVWDTLDILKSDGYLARITFCD